MTSMTAWPASCLTALVTSSLVSRRATSRSTGTGQDRMAARTRRRASAAAAGPVARGTWSRCRSAGRGGAVVVIGFLRAPVRPGRAPGRVARCSMSVDASIDAICIARHRSADGYWFAGVDVGFFALLVGFSHCQKAPIASLGVVVPPMAGATTHDHERRSENCISGRTSSTGGGLGGFHGMRAWRVPRDAGWRKRQRRSLCWHRRAAHRAQELLQPPGHHPFGILIAWMPQHVAIADL